MNKTSERRNRRHWWSIGGTVVGLSAFAWAFWRVDYGRLIEVIGQADITFVIMMPLAIAAEQFVRAWKWRQLLSPIRLVGTLRLFGAIMAGYFANLLAPLGLSPIVRSWLVARLEALKMSAVLATAAIDRLVDGLVFTGFVAFAVAFAVFPDPNGNIRLSLVVGGLGSFALFALLLFALARYKQRAGHPDAWVTRLADRLPARFVDPVKRVLISFAGGIVWPREARRGLGILFASIVIKLIAITHFLWAGLAFGLVLRPVNYVFLVVFLGFLIILSRLARIPGGFFVGAIFALDLLGVPDEPALAMVLLVQVSSIFVIASIGAIALFRSGITLDELRSAKSGAVGGT
ncbi:MAG: lysylphosphatidylglycerol synthase transmembrane domain-containing protein [Alphaproteobacteria bacterium]